MAGQEGPPSDNLYIAGLPVEFNTEATAQFFNACGTVVQAKSLGHGNALVRFATVQEAMLCKDNMNGQQPMGCPKPLSISFATTERHDDWMCPRCQDLQFAKNSVCRLCGFPRPTGDADADAATLTSWGPYSGPPGNSYKASGKGFNKGIKGKGVVVAPPTSWPPPTSTPDADWGWNSAPPKGGYKGAVVAPYDIKGAGKGGKGDKGGWPLAPGVKGMIDGLIAEGLPGGQFSRDKNALYITNLPHDTTDSDLYIIFNCFGAIPPRGVKVMPGLAGQRLYGFVNFMDQANAEFAMMAMNGVTQPDGVKLIVKLKNAKGEGKKGFKDAVAPAAGKGTWDGANPLPAFAGPAGVTAAIAAAAAPLPPAGVEPIMLERIKTKIAAGPTTSYDVSQWYIMEYLNHITEEEEMKASCDQLLSACAFLGLS